MAFLSLLASGALPKAEFWEKPEAWRRITEKRQILVSAKNEGGRTYSQGAGLVNASLEDVWAFATNPEKIKSTSRLLKDFQWNQETGEVDVRLEFLMVTHRVRGRARKYPDPQNPRIEFEVLESSVVPFTCELELRSSGAQRKRAGAPEIPEGRTLVRLSGLSSEDRAMSWPLRVALEAVLQRTAGYLREAVEADAQERSASR